MYQHSNDYQIYKAQLNLSSAYLSKIMCINNYQLHRTELFKHLKTLKRALLHFKKYGYIFDEPSDSTNILAFNVKKQILLLLSIQTLTIKASMKGKSMLQIGNFFAKVSIILSILSKIKSVTTILLSNVSSATNKLQEIEQDNIKQIEIPAKSNHQFKVSPFVVSNLNNCNAKIDEASYLFSQVSNQDYKLCSSKRAFSLDLIQSTQDVWSFVKNEDEIRSKTKQFALTWILSDSDWRKFKEEIKLFSKNNFGNQVVYFFKNKLQTLLNIFTK